MNYNGHHIEANTYDNKNRQYRRFLLFRGKLKPAELFGSAGDVLLFLNDIASQLAVELA